MLKLENISKTFESETRKKMVLDQINITLKQGELISIYGSAGCGKSTLLNIIYGLYKPDQGRVLFMNEDIEKMSSERLLQYKRQDVNYIMQGYSLLNNLSVKQNMTLLRKANLDIDNRLEGCMEDFGLGDFLDAYPINLSGGQAKMVAITRGIINPSKIIVADEPTAHLDRKNAKRVVNQLRKEVDKGRSVIISSHDQMVLDQSDRNYLLEK
jgi:ABC-type lipoprotein export system ATPase subunit